MKPALKAPGTRRLKVICDGPLSKIAFTINLRRYIMVLSIMLGDETGTLGEIPDALKPLSHASLIKWGFRGVMVGRTTFKPVFNAPGVLGFRV
jgi:hypothetical protein